jgi:hypothetical protein
MSKHESGRFEKGNGLKHTYSGSGVKTDLGKNKALV